MRFGIGLALLGVLLGGAVASYGLSTVSVQLTGAGGAQYGLGSNYAYGQYLMPYYLTINNSNPIAVVCDDYLHLVSVGDKWTATTSTFADLTNTRFGAAHATEYREAIWIASQINGSSSLSDVAGAQFAIWKLLTPGTPVVPGASTWIAKAQLAATQNYGGMSFSNWQILTPLNPLSPQEYLFRIPEPGVMLMFCLGLVAFASVWNWRVRLQAKAKL